MSKPRAYTKEFKEEAVSLALSSPSIAKTAQELGVPIPTLHTWIKKLKSTTPVGASSNGAPSMAALIEENRRLHKELKVAREEREILKKAAAYFAQHQE